jgi:hypothetical protein
MQCCSASITDSTFCSHLEDRFKQQVDRWGDLWSGTEYKRLRQPGEFLGNKWNISLSLNTDGVAVFHASFTGSLWPVYLVVNELPAKLRYNMIQALKGQCLISVT